ncbi:hypothetical protein QTI05_22795 [Variovorax sp. J22R193]|uniref:hypothetical protein n=1 Tax=Variovorax fucosicus TaxID=3053517 RepID=UPI0025784AB6|nr:hypothetical protein [Variovorax sp. J22R193]MDM0041887.1 hypothetical protein [Variovorax sp. J22R193]
MANSTSPVPQVVEGTGAVQKINEQFDAGSQALVGGRNAAVSALLAFGIIGGRVNGQNGANTTLNLTASSTNYIVWKKSDGVISFATGTTNWDNSADYWRLYSVVTNTTTWTSYTDERSSSQGIFGIAAVALTNPMTTAEDIIKGGASGVPARLAAGSNGQVLSVVAGAVAWATLAGTGDVVGPAVAVDDRIATFDGTTGKLIQDGGKTIADLRSPAIQSVTSSATVTPTFLDDIVLITAQAAGLTLANPTGTAISGLGMVIRIKDNGTARSIAYGTQYRAIGVTLPTTTVLSKTLYLAMIYNAADTKWDVVAVGQEA